MPRAYATKVEHACERCGTVRLYRPSEVKKFCSHACYIESRRGVRTGFRINKMCRQCGEYFVKLRSQIGDYCSKACADAAKVQPAEERFWSKVDKNGPVPSHMPHLGPCWLWTAGLDTTGYGKFWMNGRTRRAHVVAYEFTKGPLPVGTLGLHRCDNPACVRPDHVFAGSYADNTRDMMEKGRKSKTTAHRPASGERHGSRTHPERILRGAHHPQAKVTEDVVRAIRERRALGVPYRVLAQEYGITPTQACAIALGRSWRHVP